MNQPIAPNGYWKCKPSINPDAEYQVCIPTDPDERESEELDQWVEWLQDQLKELLSYDDDVMLIVAKEWMPQMLTCERHVNEPVVVCSEEGELSCELCIEEGLF